MRLTENFTREELACKCGCGRMNIPMEEIERLQRVRTAVGFPMPITSAYRCADHNEKVSSTGRDGPHTKAAFDVVVRGDQALRLIECARAHGFNGIGVQQKGASRFIHLDALPDAPGQPRPTIWSY
jgi:uncharacterized protein YcbK (DUF882 family)